MDPSHSSSYVPRDFESLRSAIIDRRQDLPKRLAQVAGFALSNPDDIAFGTTASIATMANVQPSTLVRFARHFNYSGFSDLQSVFRSRLRDRSSSYEDRLRQIASDRSDLSGNIANLDGFLTASSRSIDNMIGSISSETLDAAIEVLAGADTIHIVAKRRSYAVAAHMSYAFGQLKIRHQIIASPNGVDGEMIEMARPGDVAIVVSFAPYAEATRRQKDALMVRDIPIVAITDSAFSPISDGTAAWFEVAEADYGGFRSLSATFALSMALTVGIAERRRKED